MATQATTLQPAQTGVQVKTRKKRELSLGKQLLYQAMLLIASSSCSHYVVASLSLIRATSRARPN
jgi:hypothetical protein